MSLLASAIVTGKYLPQQKVWVLVKLAIISMNNSEILYSSRDQGLAGASSETLIPVCCLNWVQLLEPSILKELERTSLEQILTNIEANLPQFNTADLSQESKKTSVQNSCSSPNGTLSTSQRRSQLKVRKKRRKERKRKRKSSCTLITNTALLCVASSRRKVFPQFLPTLLSRRPPFR